MYSHLLGSYIGNVCLNGITSHRGQTFRKVYETFHFISLYLVPFE